MTNEDATTVINALRELIEEKFDKLERLTAEKFDSMEQLTEERIASVRRDSSRHSRRMDGQALREEVQDRRMDRLEKINVFLAALLLIHSLADVSPVILDLLKGLL